MEIGGEGRSGRGKQQDSANNGGGHDVFHRDTPLSGQSCATKVLSWDSNTAR
jgi:hypothetical protein